MFKEIQARCPDTILRKADIREDLIDALITGGDEYHQILAIKRKRRLEILQELPHVVKAPWK